MSVSGIPGTRSIWCHGHIAHAYAIHGAFDAALNHAEEGSRIASETGRPLDRVFADHRRGEILLVSGQFEQAAALFENAFAVANTEAEDAPIFRTWFACDQAPAYLASGRLEDAAAVLAVQHENAKRMELKQFGAWIVLRKAELGACGRPSGCCDGPGGRSPDNRPAARRPVTGNDCLESGAVLRIGPWVVLATHFRWRLRWLSLGDLFLNWKLAEKLPPAPPKAEKYAFLLPPGTTPRALVIPEFWISGFVIERPSC